MNKHLREGSFLEKNSNYLKKKKWGEQKGIIRAPPKKLLRDKILRWILKLVGKSLRTGYLHSVKSVSSKIFLIT